MSDIAANWERFVRRVSGGAVWFRERDRWTYPQADLAAGVVKAHLGQTVRLRAINISIASRPIAQRVRHLKEPPTGTAAGPP